MDLVVLRCWSDSRLGFKTKVTTAIMPRLTCLAQCTLMQLVMSCTVSIGYTLYLCVCVCILGGGVRDVRRDCIWLYFQINLEGGVHTTVIRKIGFVPLIHTLDQSSSSLCLILCRHIRKYWLIYVLIQSFYFLTMELFPWEIRVAFIGKASCVYIYIYNLAYC